jgi:CheY-like chemotaxis protein
VHKLSPLESEPPGVGLHALTQELLSGRHITDDLYLLPDNSSVEVQKELAPTPHFDVDRNRLGDLVWNVLQWVARDRQKVTLGTSSDERYSYLVAGSGERAQPLAGPYGDYFRAPDSGWTRLLPARDLEFLRRSGAQIAATEDLDPRRLVVRFPHRQGARTAPGRGLRVLAIDDQEIIRDLLLNMFMGMGHEVRVCGSGEEGLEALAADSYDLVLTDLGMPGMSGWEVASAVKKRSPNIPVVLITGWGFNFAEEQVRKAVAAGPLTTSPTSSPCRSPC